MATIGLYGGSFDPPHVGHLLLGHYVLATAPVDQLLLVPVFVHAFGKGSVSFEHRLAMAGLLADLLGDRAASSDVEARLGAPSRTIRTLRALQEIHPQDSFRLIIGQDVLSERHKWQAWDEITRLAPPIIVGRQGAEPPTQSEALELQLPDVSSTEVRRRLAGGEDASKLLPRVISAYIKAEGLYPEEL